MGDDSHDWRLATQGRLKEDLPAAYPGGPAHKAGTILEMASLVTLSDGRRISFGVPSSSAMALNVSASAGQVAKATLGALDERSVPAPAGPVLLLSPNSRLYDYFEQCMIASTFAHQAVEAYCNYTIRFHLKGTLSVSRGNKVVAMTETEIERKLSTADKANEIVPKLLGLPPLKTKSEWEDFQFLKRARDATVHLKHADQVGADENTLFYRYLSDDPYSYATAAARVIRALCTTPPQWLLAFDTRWST